MSTERDLSGDGNRVVRSWLREDRHEDASRVLGAALDAVDTTPQRRSTPWAAWRDLFMNNNVVRVGLVAAAVVVIAVIAINLLPGSTPPGGTPTVSPSVEPSQPAEPSTPSAPPLSQSFTSTQHGISLSYPEGWTAEAATGPWTEATFPLEFGQPHGDWLADPILGSNLFLAIASQPIGDSTPEDWVAEQMASGEGCAETEPVTVDGASGLTGLIGAGECNIAAVTSDGRGYWIQLYTSDDDPLAVAPYDRAWFDEVLATVQLHPEDAVD